MIGPKENTILLVEILKRTQTTLGLSLKNWERLAQSLSLISFVVICFVAHRALEPRTFCIQSSFVQAVQIGRERFENCQYESRLSLVHFGRQTNKQILQQVRALEGLEPLKDILQIHRPSLVVSVDSRAPQRLEVDQGTLYVGADWLKSPQQRARALTYGILHHLWRPTREVSGFDLLMWTDFLVVAVLQQDDWSGRSMRNELRFPTAAVTFTRYCESPFRSLAHGPACNLRGPAGEIPAPSLTANIWGHDSLLAMLLARVFERLPIGQQLALLQRLPDLPTTTPELSEPADGSLEARVFWLQARVRSHLEALGLQSTEQSELAIQQAYLAMDLSTPTRWELTVDITHTPAWPEILEQFRAWSKLRPKQRMLIFTPKGQIALPVNLPVDWPSEAVQSQKHVLIACSWPKPTDAININARHLFAQQSCGKVQAVFWN